MLMLSALAAGGDCAAPDCVRTALISASSPDHSRREHVKYELPWLTGVEFISDIRSHVTAKYASVHGLCVIVMRSVRALLITV